MSRLDDGIIAVLIVAGLGSGVAIGIATRQAWIMVLFIGALALVVWKSSE